MRAGVPILAAAVLSCVCAACPLHAQSATAEALFQEGKALMKAAKYDEACPKLEESFRQDPATGALLALAMCHEKMGRLASAWAEYVDVASRSKQEGRKDRVDAARAAADALQPRLSQLTLDVSAESGKIPNLEIRRDGVLVGRGAWGTATPVDEGQHTIEATATGREPWSTTLSIGSNADRRTIVIPELQPLTPPSNVTEAGARPSSAQPKVTRKTAHDSTTQNRSYKLERLQIAGLVAGGVGVVALGVGTYYGATALRGKSDTDSTCPATGCTQLDDFGKRRDAHAAGDKATIAFIAGGALVATGIALYVVGGSKPNKSSARAGLVPVLGPHDATMALTGSF